MEHDQHFYPVQPRFIFSLCVWVLLWKSLRTESTGGGVGMCTVNWLQGCERYPLFVWEKSDTAGQLLQLDPQPEFYS